MTKASNHETEDILVIHPQIRLTPLQMPGKLFRQEPDPDGVLEPVVGGVGVDQVDGTELFQAA